MLASAAPGIPASVRDMIGQRVARLSAPARAVVELASIVPTRAELWLLRDALLHRSGIGSERLAQQP